ncbi:putative E3 ubiquitin-protein ligase makorin-2 [Lonchura striata]|uniref:E3 ubiquitin-protein ligase makorin-2 n=1 Tax=Lonchura striata TaxID=40157 RepID=A0A218V0V4_9PASE|nr:putative E3 ubiquitin-protein ligase makorin-2 [Lonchura striata domestica]
MSTEQVMCKYYVQRECWEANKFLLSHNLPTSKSSTIFKYYQKGKCAYSAWYRCDQMRVTAPEQRKAHKIMCMATFELDMEKAFAFQASQVKVCSICVEVLCEKPPASERRFGILSNCNHTYFLSCIWQWRCAK